MHTHGALPKNEVGGAEGRHYRKLSKACECDLPLLAQRSSEHSLRDAECLSLDKNCLGEKTGPFDQPLLSNKFPK